MKIVQFCMACFWVIAAGSASAATKNIGILVYDGVLTSDVTAPLEVFGVASRLSWFSGYQVVTIGLTQQSSITTEEGLVLGVDMSIDEAQALDNFDVLLVPSRYEMQSLISNTSLISFISEQSTSVEWLASNCSGSLLLAEAGVLNGKKATTWAGGEKNFQKKYPQVDVQHDKNWVVDGNVLTSNGSVVSYQAALTLLKNMTSESKAQEVADTLQFSRLSSLSF